MCWKQTYICTAAESRLLSLNRAEAREAVISEDNRDRNPDAFEQKLESNTDIAFKRMADYRPGFLRTVNYWGNKQRATEDAIEQMVRKIAEEEADLTALHMTKIGKILRRGKAKMRLALIDRIAARRLQEFREYAHPQQAEAMDRLNKYRALRSGLQQLAGPLAFRTAEEKALLLTATQKVEQKFQSRIQKGVGIPQEWHDALQLENSLREKLLEFHIVTPQDNIDELLDQNAQGNGTILTEKIKAAEKLAKSPAQQKELLRIVRELQRRGWLFKGDTGWYRALRQAEGKRVTVEFLLTHPTIVGRRLDISVPDVPRPLMVKKRDTADKTLYFIDSNGWNHHLDLSHENPLLTYRRKDGSLNQIDLDLKNGAYPFSMN